MAGKQTLEKLLETLSNDLDWRNRNKAIDKLAEIDDEKAMTTIARALRDENPVTPKNLICV